MAKKIIEARVIQKVGTEQEWMDNDLILYEGEIALVRLGDSVINMKVGTGDKAFRDLPYMVIGDVSDYIITPQNTAQELLNLPLAVYRAQGKGTYNLLVSEAVEGVTINGDKTVVAEGYDVKFIKSETGWKVASSVKMPDYDDTALQNRITQIGKISDSAFNSNVQFANDSVTNTIINAIKKLEVSYTTDNQLFFLNLLYRNNTNNTIYLEIKRIVNGVESIVLSTSITPIAGLNTYTFNTSSGIVKITADFDNVTNTTLPTSSAIPIANKTINAEMIKTPIDDIALQRTNYGIFNKTALFNLASENVTQKVLKSFLSVKIKGNWYNRKFGIVSFRIYQGVVRFAINEELSDGTLRSVYSSNASIVEDTSHRVVTYILDDSTNSLAAKEGLVFEITIDRNTLPTPRSSDGMYFNANNGPDATNARQGFNMNLVIDGNLQEISLQRINYGIFNKTANFTAGYDNVTQQVLKSFLSVKIKGNWYNRRFGIVSLNIYQNRVNFSINEELADGTTRQTYAGYSPEDTSHRVVTYILDDSTNNLSRKEGLVFEITIDRNALPPIRESDGRVFSASNGVNVKHSAQGFNMNLVIDGNNREVKSHNTIKDMVASTSTLPIQSAGSLLYRLNDTRLPRTMNSFTPMWNAYKGINRPPKVTHKILNPPTVAGHFNDHCVLQDIGRDDVFYIAGVSDKRGRLYKSLDYGNTIVEFFNFSSVLQSYESVHIVYATKELPNGEILVNVAVKDENTGERSSRVYVSSNNQTTFSRSYVGQVPLEMSHYIDRGTNNNITFEVIGRVINGWGFDAWKNYVVLTEYGNRVDGGTSSAVTPEVDAVGHMVCGKIWLSEDYGVTFKQIFDYITPPSNIIFETYPGGHHAHGVFIDKYHLTNGKPRIVGIMGDQNNRFVSTDDMGDTWQDNWGRRNGTHQSVSAIAVPQGYLTLPDNTIHQDRNGVQLIHRAVDWSNMYSDLVCNFLTKADYDTFYSSNPIVYCGGNIYQRDANSPIVACYTPETAVRYNTGARGGIVISFDGGITWEELWRDNVGALQAIQYAMVWTDKNGDIWLAPSALSVLNYDSLGLRGRLIKFEL